MSLFGQNTGGASSSGGGGLFNLNLNTSGGGVDAQGKRKSIFDASTSHSNNSQPQQSSSLFGTAPATGTNTSSTPSLFGGPGTNMANSSSTPLSSLGQSTTTAANTTANLFGASSATTSAASAGGLFGQKTTTTTAAPTGGLFGNAPAGSLFGSTTTTTAAPTGGLFASNAPTAAAPSGAAFGTSGAGAGLGGSLFGNSQAPQQTAQQNETAAGGQKQSREGAYFNSLLERQKKKVKLQPSDPNFRRSQLPNLNMDLGDLARRAQELGGRSQAADVSDSRAHYLLAGSGVAPGQSARGFKVTEQQVAPQNYQTMPDHQFETETYIRNLQAKGRDAIMRENMERVYKEVDTYIEQSLGVDFEEQKTRIMKHFGLIKEDEAPAGGPQASAFGKSAAGKNGATTEKSRSVFGRSALSKSIIGSAGSVNGTSSYFRGSVSPAKGGALLRGQTARDLRDKERLFVEQVEQFNAARLGRKERTAYPIMGHFLQVEANAGGDSPPQLADAYRALREITKEGSATERQYAQTYIQEAKGSEIPEDVSKQILDGARTHLEKSFFREVESIVEKNPREAQIGGQPTVINKIRAYIRVRAARKDLAPDGAELQQIGDDGEYCWILIFYLIRAGYIREAADYVSNDPAFQSTDRRFVSYMLSYASSPDRKLTKQLQPMIDAEYGQRAKIAPKGTVDPYRMACYKVVGRCDLESRNLETIGQGIDDWLWLQFVLARQVSREDEMSGTPFGLEHIQETITEIGGKHFQRGQADASTAYGTFFFMQILSGMFEQAVDYLHAFNAVSAVHFAIALSYYGLLRPVADFGAAANELLYKTTTEQYQINFIPLIAYYTAAFRIALPVAAVDYLCLICLNSDIKPKGDEQTQACHEALRELCLETREFARLLGDIRSDGARMPGAIEQRKALIKLDSKDEFLRSIITQSAAVADQRGQVADAVLLYHLCEDYDSVVGVLNRALADAVSLDLGEAPIQLQPLKPRSDHESSTISPQSGPASTLSLTQSITNPIELAKNMAALYNRDQSYFGKVSNANRETCGGLLRLAAIRSHLESDPPKYMPALQELNEIGVLPLEAKGSIPAIRSAASMFGAMPPLLARCIGVAVVWAVKAIGGERDRIVRQGSWEAGYGNDGDGVKEQLGSMAKDLMVFAGLVKYKLPSRVYDMLTKAGGDVGHY